MVSGLGQEPYASSSPSIPSWPLLADRGFFERGSESPGPRSPLSVPDPVGQWCRGRSSLSPRARCGAVPDCRLDFPDFLILVCGHSGLRGSCCSAVLFPCPTIVSIRHGILLFGNFPAPLKIQEACPWSGWHVPCLGRAREDHSMKEQMENLLYQALETEIGGYRSTRPRSMRAERRPERRVGEVSRGDAAPRADPAGGVGALGIDPETDTPGRKVLRFMAIARAGHGDGGRGRRARAAQLVAAEALVRAETKDHQNWELIGEVARTSTGEEGKRPARRVPRGRARGGRAPVSHAWMGPGAPARSLGMPAVLPPPEEKKNVTTAIGAARAKQARKTMTRGRKGRAPQADTLSRVLPKAAPRVSDDGRRKTSVVGDPAAGLAEVWLSIPPRRAGPQLRLAC